MLMSTAIQKITLPEAHFYLKFLIFFLLLTLCQVPFMLCSGVYKEVTCCLFYIVFMKYHLLQNCEYKEKPPLKYYMRQCLTMSKCNNTLLCLSGAS